MMPAVENVVDDTSLITVLSSLHGRQRREERDISKHDLQAAVKYGVQEPSAEGEGRIKGRWKFTYNGVVYITDATTKK
jgi:hypothetical protein